MLRQEKFDQFGPSVLGLGNLASPSHEIDAVCAVFDLQGVTVFCRQVDPQLVLPGFLSQFLEWLFGAIKSAWVVGSYEKPREGFVPTYTRLPFFAKFMGDGVLFLWDVSDLPESAISNVPGLLLGVLSAYETDFVPRVTASVSNAPSRLRCGVARGKVFSVGAGHDFVGPCINIAARLQKVSSLSFALSRRGFDAERSMSPAMRQALILKKTRIRGIGDDELVWIDREEFEALPAAETSDLREP
jgi:class 3 adenylate cyclase